MPAPSAATPARIPPPTYQRLDYRPRGQILEVPQVPSCACRLCRTNASPSALAGAAAQQRLGTTARRFPIVAAHDQEEHRKDCSLRPTFPRDGADGDVLLGGVPRGRESLEVSNRPVSCEREQNCWTSGGLTWERWGWMILYSHPRSW